MNSNAGIEFLKSKLATVEIERKKVQAAVARLPKLDTEVQAIKLLLATYTGETDQYPSTDQSPLYSSQGNSVSSLVYRALTEAGKPQKTEALLAFLASHGKQTTSATLRSTIYMRVKSNKLFKVVAPGVYGLKEWQ